MGSNVGMFQSLMLPSESTDKQAFSVILDVLYCLVSSTPPLKVAVDIV